MEILAVGTIFDGLGGGANVSFEVLKVLPALGIKVTLQVPVFYLHRSVLAYLSSKSKGVQNPMERINAIRDSGVDVPDFIEKRINELIATYSEDPSDYRAITSPYFLYRALKEDRKVSRKLRSLKNYDFVFCLNETYPIFRIAMEASSMFRKIKCLVMAHTEPYKDKSFRKRRQIKENYSVKVRNYIIRRSWEKALKKNVIMGLAAPSMAPLEMSGLTQEIKDRDISLYVPGPPWCLSSLFYEARNSADKNGALFLSRLVTDKGIFEIPKIVSQLREKRITLVGSFTRDEDRVKFTELSESAGISVDYMGYIDDKDVPSVLARHKVLLYPTHADAFPFTVAQALTVGTSVVAYDIPAIAMNYGGLDTVSVVKEWDTVSMSSEANRILEMPGDEYAGLHESEVELAFVQKFRDCSKIWKGYGDWVLRVLISAS